MKNTTHNEKRLKILNQKELQSLYSRPDFTNEERSVYFSLSEHEKRIITTLRSTKTKVIFILQLGYFKAKKMFFSFDLIDVKEDVLYILDEHFKKSKLPNYHKIAKNTWLKQQHMIFELLEYKNFDSEIVKEIKEKIRKIIVICSKPIYIFREVINYLFEKRIVIPKYSYFQKTISKALILEKQRLSTILEKYLSHDNIMLLETLLEDSPGLYAITEIKHEPKDFKYNEIKCEINRGKQINLLYLLSKEVLPKLNISDENIKYYASLVNYYSVYKLKRLSKWSIYLYLLCFVHYRYQQINDNLINAFIFKVRNYLDESKLAAKEKMYNTNFESNQNIKKAGEVLNLFWDEKIDENISFKEFKTIAFKILEEEKIKDAANKITENKNLDESVFQWEHIDSLTKQFQQNIKQIILTVEFESMLNKDPLIEAVNFIKCAFIKGRSINTYPTKKIPIKIIPKNMKQYIFEKKELLGNRYIFFIYMLLRNKLESGDIFCRGSVKYRSFEDDLIDSDKWEKKNILIAEAGLEKLNQPIYEHLLELENQLEERIEEVNRSIDSGNNKYFEIKKIGKNVKWTLKYPKDTETTNHKFFSEIKSVDISDVIYYVNQQCHFIEAFEHILGQYSKQELDINILIACLIAWGTNMGLSRMGEISDLCCYLYQIIFSD